MLCKASRDRSDISFKCIYFVVGVGTAVLPHWSTIGTTALSLPLDQSHSIPLADQQEPNRRNFQTALAEQNPTPAATEQTTVKLPDNNPTYS
jgi:hypothetical protein